jgi:hypothetical protein
MLCAAGWKDYRIDRLKESAFRAGDADPDQLHARIAFLAEAAALGPEHTGIHYDLGFAHGKLADLLDRGIFSDRRAAREEATLALQEYLNARDACPLSSRAQLGISGYASKLIRGASAEDYIRRAKLLTPGQYEMWYVCGLWEFTLNHPEEAWATWRHCLELSDHYLPQILSKTYQLKTNQLMDKVLPDDPEVLFAAAFYLYPDFGSVERRRPFLEKALRLLESKEEALGLQDLLVKARIYKVLDLPDQAILLYRELLKRDASQVRVRYEFASYLHEVRKPEEAQHELLTILAQESKNGAAKSLLNTIVHDMLQEKALERKRQQEDWWLRHRQR